MKQLTRAEEQVMQVLWEIDSGFVRDVIAQLPKPPPAYNTVSTILRILVRKGFAEYTPRGKTHEYKPKISKGQYRSFYLNELMKKYFDDSLVNLFLFIARDKQLRPEDLKKTIAQVIKDLDH